jgi:hypothetical protein
MIDELVLFDLSGWVVATVRVEGMAEGGLFVVAVAAEAAASVPEGRSLRFQCALSSGDVRGMAEVVDSDAEKGQLRLRLLEIENEGGLPRLLAAVHAWLTTRTAPT